jgi:hypothetical protein
MFSALRAAEYSTPTLVAFNAEGKPTVLNYELAGSGGFNEVRRQVRSRIAKNKAKTLCRKVARRVAREEDLKSLDLSTVQVITATHNIDAYFAGNKTPVRQKVHATCPVKEESSATIFRQNLVSIAVAIPFGCDPHSLWPFRTVLPRESLQHAA